MPPSRRLFGTDGVRGVANRDLTPELALAIGYGMSEDRRQVPNIHEPHSFNMAWVRAAEDEGMLRHRHSRTQALLVKSGRWAVTLNGGRPTASWIARAASAIR